MLERIVRTVRALVRGRPQYPRMIYRSGSDFEYWYAIYQKPRAWLGGRVVEVVGLHLTAQFSRATLRTIGTDGRREWFGGDSIRAAITEAKQALA